MSEKEFKIEISDFDKQIESIMAGERALSYSACSAFLKSPKHFYEYKTNKETTPAMEEGKIFHMACLEPEIFKENYWVLDDSEKVNDLLTNGYKDAKDKLIIPTSPRATKVYKKWLEGQDLLNKGKERLSQEDYDTYIRMSNALKMNDSSGILMKNLTSTEEDFETVIDGFKLKGKIDGVGQIKIKGFRENKLGLKAGEKFQIDLKKVADASYKKVRWNIFDMNYELQGGLYANANRIGNYFLIFIDKSCNITVVKLSETTRQDGFTKLENCLSEFTRCAEENQWHASYDFFNGGFILV